MPEQHRHLANKYKDIVNLQGVEAYHGGHPPTACSKIIYSNFIFKNMNISKNVLVLKISSPSCLISVFRVFENGRSPSQG